MLQVIGTQYNQYGSSTFYKGLRLTIPTNLKAEDSKNAVIKTNGSDGGFEDEEKHETER